MTSQGPTRTFLRIELLLVSLLRLPTSQDQMYDLMLCLLVICLVYTTTSSRVMHLSIDPSG